MSASSDHRGTDLAPDTAGLLAAAAGLAGLVHLVAPEGLLWLARVCYDRVLAVSFRPREPATRRVRLVGLAMLAVAAGLTAVRRAGRSGEGGR